MKRLLTALLASGLLAVPLARCSSNLDDCRDVARKRCEKGRDCGFLGVPLDRCVDVFAEEARRRGVSAEECREEWPSLEAMSCAEYDEEF